jgi:hypothetical protein
MSHIEVYVMVVSFSWVRFCKLVCAETLGQLECKVPSCTVRLWQMRAGDWVGHKSGVCRAWFYTTYKANSVERCFKTVVMKSDFDAARSECLTLVWQMGQVPWDVMLCYRVSISEWSHCVDHQGQAVLTLKMNALWPFEMSGTADWCSTTQIVSSTTHIVSSTTAEDLRSRSLTDVMWQTVVKHCHLKGVIAIAASVSVVLHSLLRGAQTLSSATSVTGSSFQSYIVGEFSVCYMWCV